jgi:RNA polymerase sigma-70 factor, ECF subfamily
VADDEGFDDFYRSTSRRLLRYAFAMTGDRAEAQDVVQEAYIRAWRRWSRVGRFEHTESWVRLVVTRLCTDRWRRLRVRRGAAAAHALAAPPTAPPGEDTVLLVAALRRLPAKQRRALCLFYLLDLTVAEIATEAGVPVNTVKSWLSRGRSALAEQLGSPAAREGNGVR